jgi:folate-dependent phosphoribosylglycinamide formyltransferase PurN
LRHNAFQAPHRYHHLERIARRAGISVHYIDNINDEAMHWREDHVRLIVVAGSRIIKPPVVARFCGRLVNFHSGLLPHYRGPYSEFWAMYETRPQLIGCSVHLIDEGIDTGPLLATRAAVLPDRSITPQEAHHLNVLQAVPMVAQTVADYASGRLTPVPQPPGGTTYTHPSPDELASMTERIGRRFSVDFIE